MTIRQEKILNRVVKEYIKTAKPIGSLFFEEKCNLDVCSATIRNEMKTLTDMGYLFQPHTSSGRVPTSKGYRFFVDALLRKELNREEEKEEEEKEEEEKSFEKDIRVLENKMKEIAISSCGLAFAYFIKEDFFIAEGWSVVLKNPEFEERDFLEDFISQFESLEKKIKEEFLEMSDFEICIGKEKTIIDSENLSLIVSKNKFPGAYLGILGPSRMEYHKNINLILNYERRKNKKRR